MPWARLQLAPLATEVLSAPLLITPVGTSQRRSRTRPVVLRQRAGQRLRQCKVHAPCPCLLKPFKEQERASDAAGEQHRTGTVKMRPIARPGAMEVASGDGNDCSANAFRSGRRMHRSIRILCIKYELERTPPDGESFRPPPLIQTKIEYRLSVERANFHRPNSTRMYLESIKMCLIHLKHDGKAKNKIINMMTPLRISSIS